MKRCPKCGLALTDDNDYCLEDGTLLVGDFGGQSFGSFQSPGEVPTQVVARPQTTNPQFIDQPGSMRNGTTTSQYLIFGVILLLAMAAVGFGVAFFTSSQNKLDDSQAAANGSDEQRRFDDKRREREAENERLRIERERLEREKSAVSSVPLTAPGYPTVTVNSPRDGYLALKSEPCIAPCGRTLVKIPHGTRLTFGSCKESYEVADRRRGKWCYTNYAGQTGWVFDGFVSY